MRTVKIIRFFCIVVMTLLVGCGGGSGSNGGSGDKKRGQATFLSRFESSLSPLNDSQ